MLNRKSQQRVQKSEETQDIIQRILAWKDAPTAYGLKELTSEVAGM